MADIEAGQKSKPLHCGRLTLAFALVAAALLTLVQLSINLASYANAELGPPWAIIQANSKGGGGPDSVYIGMFRICWKSANAVSCGPFGLGLSIDKTVMQGGDAWTAVMPPTLVTATYPLVGLAAFVFTFAAAFAFCQCSPPTFTVFIALLAVLSDIGFLGLALGLFFWYRGNIITKTNYEPHHVLLTVLFDAIIAIMELVILFLAFVTQAQRGRGVRPKGKRTIEITRNQSAAEKSVLSKLGRLEAMLKKFQAGAEAAIASESGESELDEAEKAGLLGGKVDGIDQPPDKATLDEKALRAFRDKHFPIKERNAIKQRRILLDKSHSSACQMVISDMALEDALYEMRTGKKRENGFQKLTKQLMKQAKDEAKRAAKKEKKSHTSKEAKKEARRQRRQTALEAAQSGAAQDDASVSDFFTDAEKQTFALDGQDSVVQRQNMSRQNSKDSGNKGNSTDTNTSSDSDSSGNDGVNRVANKASKEGSGKKAEFRFRKAVKKVAAANLATKKGQLGVSANASGSSATKGKGKGKVAFRLSRMIPQRSQTAPSASKSSGPSGTGRVAEKLGIKRERPVPSKSKTAFVPPKLPARSASADEPSRRQRADIEPTTQLGSIAQEAQSLPTVLPGPSTQPMVNRAAQAFRRKPVPTSQAQPGGAEMPTHQGNKTQAGPSVPQAMNSTERAAVADLTKEIDKRKGKAAKKDTPAAENDLGLDWKM